MKPYLYIIIFAFLAISCSTSRLMTMEDDIYYIPGEKALVVKEIENTTGKEISPLTHPGLYSGSTQHLTSNATPPATFSQNKQQAINTRSGQVETADMAQLTTQAEELLTRNEEVNETLYKNTGYWMGGFKGNESDLPEIQRIINLYPQGFAFVNSNGFDIAMNLSFDPDWNVYTDNGRYWWFPSNSNIQLYSSLLFGTYPQYIWTVIWDNPRFDIWSFNNNFNWGINLGWRNSYWNLGFGWNPGWYNPWYDPWYGNWYNPWYGPGWYHPHWHHHWHHSHWGHPGWGGSPVIRPNRPGIAVRPNSPQRPGTGNNIIGVRPGNSVRPGVSGTRPGTITRPGNNATVRPGTTTRPGSTTRPGTATRPGANTRPGTTIRPGNSSRPGSVTRPGTINRPNSVTRPGTTPTRPGSITRPGTITRPATKNTTNGNTKTYSRPQNNYRPIYNTNSSPRYNSGNHYPGNNRSGSINSSPGRSSGGGSQAAPVRNNRGGSRRR